MVCVVCPDDILIFPRTQDEHDRHAGSVFDVPERNIQN